MPQDPSKPRDTGAISLPSTDRAMNKVAPTATTDKSDTKMMGYPRKKEAGDEAILMRGRKRMDRAISYWSDNRKNSLEDEKFRAGDQWPPDVISQRNIDKRPCLTINKVPTFLHQITNAQRENKPSIDISPRGERSDVNVAKMYRGMIRFIEQDCHASVAYNTGFEQTAGSGYGFWRVYTEYESPNSFDQVIVIRRIRNKFTVYMDPNIIEPDGSDQKWCFVTEMIPRNEFETAHPGAYLTPYDVAGIGELMKNWITADEIRVAEYYEMEEKLRTLVRLDNGHVGWEDELDARTKEFIADDTLRVVAKRQSLDSVIKWYKMTGVEILEEREWPGKWIPIVMCIGDEVDIEGKVKYSGMIRFAKDPQRMYNYWSTAETELIALAPKAPWIVEEGQIEGHEDEWKWANVKSNPYLSYKGTSIAGKQAPPPQRQQFAGVPQGVVQAKQTAAQDMMATTGVRFDATINERMFDESGKAINELRRSGDIGNFHYFDNFAQSLRHTGEILVDLIPKIYDTQRVVTILREDDSEEQVQLNPNMQGGYAEQPGPDGKIQKMFNPTVGHYGVTVTVGPSYATKRIEASTRMIEFARAVPQVAQYFIDLIAKNQDWPGAEEIAKRLAVMLPPAMLAPEQKDLPPQAQALIAQMQQQVQQLSQQLQQALGALQSKQEDQAIRREQIERDFEARLLQTVSQLEAKMASVQQQGEASFLAHVGSKIENLAGHVNELMTAIKKPNGHAE